MSDEMIRKAEAVAAIDALKIRGMRAGHLSDRWDGAIHKAIQAIDAIPASSWASEELLAEAFADTEHATIVYRERYKSWHLTPEHALRLARVALSKSPPATFPRCRECGKWKQP